MTTHDPLAHYPEMLSTRDVQTILGCGYNTAARLILTLPHADVGSGLKKKALRVSKEHIRQYCHMSTPAAWLHADNGKRKGGTPP